MAKKKKPNTPNVKSSRAETPELANRYAKTQTAAQRNANLKPFVKGDPRINREGRKKSLPKLEEVLREVLGGFDLEDSGIQEVVKNIFEQAKDKKNRRAVNAAAMLLDRAYGKAAQTIKVEGSDELKTITGFKIIRNETKDAPKG